MSRFILSWCSYFSLVTVFFPAVVLAQGGGLGFGGTEDPPNIIMIYLDDADSLVMPNGDLNDSTHQANVLLPNLQAFAAESMRFTNFHITTPLCGPSRASLLTGQYAFKTGIKVNQELPIERSQGFNGGYDVFESTGAFGNPNAPYIDYNLSRWLQHYVRDPGAPNEAYYRNLFVGKWLHHNFGPEIGQPFSEADIPPGWDEFMVSLGGSHGYFDNNRFRGDSFRVSDSLYTGANGYTDTTCAQQTKDSCDVPGIYERYNEYFPNDTAFLESSYRTNWELADTVRFIARHRSQYDSKPFFAYWAPVCPHSVTSCENDTNDIRCGMVDIPYQSEHMDLELPIDLDYDEKPIDDKPAQIKVLPEMSDKSGQAQVGTTQHLRMSGVFRERMLAMKSFDDMLGKLKAYLVAENIYENTYIIITSDNGYQTGHHRLVGKQAPYNRNTNVPLYVRGPGVVAGDRSHLLANIDLAPTILELAGATSLPPIIDGKSFKGLLSSTNNNNAPNWRSEGILLENWGVQTSRTIDDGTQEGLQRFEIKTTYASLRLHDEVYTEWADGSKEHYDFLQDPLQLENGYNALSQSEKDTFQNMLAALKAPMPNVETALTWPRYDGDKSCGAATLHGYAEDRKGVKVVRFKIKNSAGEYWNDVTKDWQGESSPQPKAVLLNHHGLISEWTFEFDPGPDKIVPNETITMEFRAISDDDQTSPWKMRQFKMTYDEPCGIIREPYNNAIVRWGHRDNSNSHRIKYTAIDSRGIRRVFMVVRDVVANKYLTDDDQWQDAYAHINIYDDPERSETELRTVYDFQPPNDDSYDYELFVRPVYASGDYDSTPHTIRFKRQ